tara:strand:+ start:350 stop:625 length:276 start_codon:yes stop_codon:yes gene_type:complete
MQKKRTLNELRQNKTFGYDNSIEKNNQTSKVKEKITEIIENSHEKLNYGTQSEKQMAVGSIQLINELHRLTKQLPNNNTLGENIRKIFGLK